MNKFNCLLILCLSFVLISCHSQYEDQASSISSGISKSENTECDSHNNIVEQLKDQSRSLESISLTKEDEGGCSLGDDAFNF